VVLAQALLAMGHHLWVTTGWLLGLVGLAAGTAVGGHVVTTRATVGLLVGAVTSAAALALLLRREWSRWTITSVGDTRPA